VPGLEDLARGFFGAYGRGDRASAAALLADDVVSYVTNADAGVDVVRGRDEYMRRVPDLRSADGSLEITQVVAIDDERVLTMVEIRARRGGMELHNFAAFLARVRGGRIAELWMVDARPEYSDRFWA
jgi:ketosteroid isomerase-like protein